MERHWQSTSGLERPSQLQKLYGSNLPPSLRYGAARQSLPSPDHTAPSDIRSFRRAPVYPKIHKSYISVETLRYYDLPWEYDRSDPEYIIILRAMDKKETDILFEHTARLHRHHSDDLPPRPSENHKPRPEFAFYRKRSRGTPQVVHIPLNSQPTPIPRDDDAGAHDDADDYSVLESGSLQSSNDSSAADSFTVSSQDSVHLGEPFAWVRTSERTKVEPVKISILEHGKSRDPNLDSESPWFKRRVKVAEQFQNMDGDVSVISESSRFRALDITEAEPSAGVAEPRNIKCADRKQYHTLQHLDLEHNAPPLKPVVHSSYGQHWARQPSSGHSTTGFFTASGKHENFDALYYFRHIQQDILNFDRFKERVVDIPELRRVRRPLDECLTRLQKQYERPSHHGSFQRQMDTFCDVSHSGHFGGTKIIAACIPFIFLRTHNHATETKTNLAYLLERLFKWRKPKPFGENCLSLNSGGTHPTRTLFQTINPKSHSRRDLKQAVCSMLGPKARSYLCVTQVWILIINEELLLTCSTLPKSDLYSSLLKRPPILEQPKPRPLHIRVETPDKRIWLLEVEKSRTYLDLASHFCEITTTFADDFEIFLDGHLILPHQWPICVQAAAKSPQVFLLKKKLASSNNHEASNRNVMHELSSPEWFALKTERDNFLKANESDTAAVAQDHDLDSSDGIAGPRSVPERDQEGSFSETTEPDMSNGNVFATLPPSSTNLFLLCRLKLPFEAKDDQLLVGPMTTQQNELLISRSFQLSLRMMRAITSSALSLDGGPLEDETSLGFTTSKDVDSCMNKYSHFDEIELYQNCHQLTSEAYHQRLYALYVKALSSEHDDWTSLASQPSTNAPLEPQDISELCEMLGRGLQCEVDSGDMEGDGRLYTDFLTGLRSLLRFFSPNTRKFGADDGTDPERQKLLAAIVKILEAFVRKLEPDSEVTALLSLQPTLEVFRHLFNVFRDLDLYSATHDTLCRTSTPAEIQKAMKQIILALLRVAQGLPLIDRVVPMMNESTPERGMHRSSKILDEFCEIISTHVDEGKEPTGYQTRFGELQMRFDESMEELKKIGWQESAARCLLECSFSWTQAKSHADIASRVLEQGLEAAFTADPAMNVRWTAAAFPSDILVLLLPDILFRPVLGDQVPLDMYNQYVTDLETEITTGEPSREMLDRIRYLRAELNAVSMLQTEQLKLIEQTSAALFPADDPKGSLFAEDDPHPGLPILRALSAGIEVQNGGIKKLYDSLEDLQVEARAQISGVQDWRDNSVVVFTIITIIFLPLSFVSSVFGMNTADVRDMNHNQWLFWICATPFTLIVIVFTLWLVDVPPLWRWIERHGKPNNEDPVYSQTGTGSRARIFAELVKRPERPVRGGHQPAARRIVPPNKS